MGAGFRSRRDAGMVGCLLLEALNASSAPKHALILYLRHEIDAGCSIVRSPRFGGRVSLGRTIWHLECSTNALEKKITSSHQHGLATLEREV